MVTTPSPITVLGFAFVYTKVGEAVVKEARGALAHAKVTWTYLPSPTPTLALASAKAKAGIVKMEVEGTLTPDTTAEASLAPTASIAASMSVALTMTFLTHDIACTISFLIFVLMQEASSFDRVLTSRE